MIVLDSQGDRVQMGSEVDVEGAIMPWIMRRSVWVREISMLQGGGGRYSESEKSFFPIGIFSR